ncbi:MAG: DNA gyrase C-terminal beta-propeller domain-containing protein [Marmoricola sp.]
MALVVGGAQLQSGDEELCFISSDAQLLHFEASAVRPQGRSGAGISGIRLSAGATVVAFCVCSPVQTRSSSRSAAHLLPSTAPTPARSRSRRSVNTQPRAVRRVGCVAIACSRAKTRCSSPGQVHHQPSLAQHQVRRSNHLMLLAAEMAWQPRFATNFRVPGSRDCH